MTKLVDLLPEDFETLGKVKADHARACRVLKASPSQTHSKAFFHCRKGHRCGREGCLLCTRVLRMKLVRATHDLGMGDAIWTRCSMVMSGLRFEEGQLHKAKLDKIVANIRKRLQRSGLTTVIAIGGVDISLNTYKNRPGWWQLHLYVLVNLPCTKTLKKLLKSAFKPEATARVSISTKQVQPGGFFDALTYSFKNGFYRRSGYDEGRLKKDGSPRKNGTPQTLKDDQFVEVTSWLLRYPIGSRLILLNVQRLTPPLARRLRLRPYQPLLLSKVKNVAQPEAEESPTGSIEPSGGQSVGSNSSTDKTSAVGVGNTASTSAIVAAPAAEKGWEGGKGGRPGLADGPILDAVRDQHGGKWYRLGMNAEDSIWVSYQQLIETQTLTLSAIAKTGVPCLTEASKTSLKKGIEDVKTFRPALVANKPGWIAGSFVLGHGDVLRPASGVEEIIVAFKTLSKFVPLGTLKGWQTAVGPIVSEQPYPLFALMIALLGPMLRFLPPHYPNILFELVGETERGKTTAGIFAASAAAGDPDNQVAGGELWDRTLNTIDAVKLRHADNFLLLDEGNLLGADRKTAAELLQVAIFKLSGTGQKERYNDDGPALQSRVSVLSTTNDPLADLLPAGPARGPAMSRMVTIQLSKGRPHGVLDTVPKGYDSVEVALEELRGLADEQYGTATPELVRRLVKALARHGEAAIKKAVHNQLQRFTDTEVAKAIPDARRRKAFAAVAAAGHFARKAGVYPKAWLKPFEVVSIIAERHALDGLGSTSRKPVVAPSELVRDYVQRHRHEIQHLENLPKPISKTELEQAAGFLRGAEGNLELLISTKRMSSEFADCIHLMKVLRSIGAAKTEAGKKKKLSIKAPKTLCKTGRIYAIRLQWLTSNPTAETRAPQAPPPVPAIHDA